jgi:hypothetical protein
MGKNGVESFFQIKNLSGVSSDEPIRSHSSSSYQVPVKPESCMGDGNAHVVILIIELDMVMGLDPDEFLGSKRFIVRLLGILRQEEEVFCPMDDLESAGAISGT